MGPRAALLVNPVGDVTDHPLVRDVNAEHNQRLSKTELICKRIADDTGAPLALLLAVVVQMIWITVGVVTHWDPYPFPFLLFMGNVVQLLLVFVILVGQQVDQRRHGDLGVGLGALQIPHGELPDLRRLSPATHSIFYDIVLRGAYAPKGMGRFDDVLSSADARQIHAFLIDQAWQAHASEQPANRAH